MSNKDYTPEDKFFYFMICITVVVMILLIPMLLGCKQIDPENVRRRKAMPMDYHCENHYENISILGNDLHRISISAEEIKLMERVVMAEAGGESYSCQEAVAQVILNRWLCEDKFPDTIMEVLQEEGQFCDPATYSTVSVNVAVHNAIIYYNTFAMEHPKTMYYFRADCYHDFGIPHIQIDNTYFSLASDASD